MEKTYILFGDIRHAGRVRVKANSKDEAISKAESGDFELIDEQGKDLAFEFDGDDDHITEE